MVSLNRPYAEVNKDDSDENAQTIDEEEGAGDEVSPSPKKSSKSFGIATVVFSFCAGLLLGALAMFMGGSWLGLFPQNIEREQEVMGESSLPGGENEAIDAIVKNTNDSIIKEPSNGENSEAVAPVIEKEEEEEGGEPEQELIKYITNVFTVLEQVDHDQTSFTQGLSYGNDGKIFETTGLYRNSKVRRINPDTFEVELSIDIDDQYFGEGSTFYSDADGNGRLIAITWQKQTGFIFDSETFEKLEEFKYTTTAPGHQGWGITYDASQQEFIVSDGSNFLYFWDRDTLVEKRKVAVTRFDGKEQNQLNELEFMDGLICCNIWHRDDIICVDPTTGKSVREYDMSSLWPANERGGSENVLNGIALGKDHVLFTGKLWDRMYKVVLPNWPTLFDPVVVDDDAALDNGDGQPAEEDNADDSENEDETAVSYNFLRTTKGSETLRLLLDDLLQSQPQQQQASFASKDHSSLSGPRRALTHLSELMELDGQILSSCHPLAHNLGRASYQLFGSFDAAYDGMVGTADAHLLRLCNAAYLHGVIEFHLRDVDDLNNLASAAREIEESVCKKMTNVNQGPWECHHGIGHGIGQRYRLEAENSVIQKGILSCKETSAPTECENGLWMDHFAVSGNILAMETRMMAADVVLAEVKGALSSLSESEKEDKDLSAIESRFQLPPRPPVLQICNHSTMPYDCFAYAATEYLLVHPGDYIGALKYCTDPSANIYNPSGVEFCIDGVGTQCAKENMDDFSMAEEVCQTLDDASQGISCFEAAMGYFMMSSPGKNPSDQGLCDNLTLYKSECIVYCGLP